MTRMANMLHRLRCLLHLDRRRTKLYAQIFRQLVSGEGNPRRLWNRDERFNELMSLVDGHTLNDKVRCYMLYQYAQQVATLPGDVAEVGVYKGGTAKLLAQSVASTDKTVHLFDTFAGMPSSDPAKDVFKEDDLTDTSLDGVQAFLQDCPNVRFHPGLFPLTASEVEQRTFCLVHIDVDIYQSVLDCCRFFYPRLHPGGAIVFDDYGFLTCPGGKMAVDEFFADKPEHPCYLPTGQCVVIRLDTWNGQPDKAGRATAHAVTRQMCSS